MLSRHLNWETGEKARQPDSLTAYTSCTLHIEGQLKHGYVYKA
jgi:hypothetical protein